MNARAKFPSDLAAHVQGRWRTFVSGIEPPPLPIEEDLQHILECAYLCMLTAGEIRSVLAAEDFGERRLESALE